MIQTQDEVAALIKKASPEVRPIVEAILLSSRLDEIKIIDDLLSDVQNRRSNLFDIIYVDLSIDRSAAPLEISGGGTLLACIEATDNLSNISVSLGRKNRTQTGALNFPKARPSSCLSAGSIFSTRRNPENISSFCGQRLCLRSASEWRTIQPLDRCLIF